MRLAHGSVHHLNGEHRGRCGEAHEREEQLVVGAPALDLHDGADTRQGDVRHGASVELEDGEPAVRVVEVDGRQPVPDQANLLERIGGLGDDLARMLRVVRVDGDDPVERRVAVGQQVVRVSNRVDVVVAGVAGVEQRANDGGIDAGGEVGNVDPGLRVGAARDRHHQRSPVLGDFRLESPLRLVRRREDETVLGGIRADAVVAQLHVPVRGVVGGIGRRFREAAVEEARVVMGPRGRRELAPVDPVGQVLTRRDVADPPAAPVGAGVTERAGDELAAVRHGHRGEGRRSLVAQAVRVEQDATLGVGCSGCPEDVLVLEARVPQLEPAVTAPPRSPRAREVPELGQPFADGRPGRQLAEDLCCQRVLRRDPCPGRGRVAVLERTVRVGDQDAVVVVDLVGGRRREVDDPAHPAIVRFRRVRRPASPRPRRASGSRS